MIAQALFKVLPVLFLISFGYFLGRRGFFNPAIQGELKQLIVNIALPSSLFLAFARVRLQSSYFLIIGIMFLACLLVFNGSRRFQSLTKINSPFFPFLMTGFEAGMLGYAIFGAVYGQENLYKLGVIDLGQVTFVFFILVPALEGFASRSRPAIQVLLSFLKTPVILAILGGIVLNQSGLFGYLSDFALFQSLLSALTMLASLTTPLVALVIGSEIRLNFAQLKAPLRTSLLRLGVWVPSAVLFSLLVVRNLLGLDPVFQAAVLTMAILPPPYVIPLYMGAGQPEDQAYVVNTLSLYTLITLFAYVLITILLPPGSS